MEKEVEVFEKINELVDAVNKLIERDKFGTRRLVEIYQKLAYKQDVPCVKEEPKPEPRKSLARILYESYNYHSSSLPSLPWQNSWGQKDEFYPTLAQAAIKEVVKVIEELDKDVKIYSGSTPYTGFVSVRELITRIKKLGE
jgi:hypothetical protein